MAQFEGVISALPTPFKNDELDRNSLKKLVQFQLSNGIEGFVVNGTTGESPTTTVKEVEAAFKAVKEEVGSRIPILVGTGSNSTQKTIEASIRAEALGADGVLVVTPYYNKPPQRGLVAHYKAVAQSVGIPVVLYNVPGRTAVSLGADATIELSQIPNIVGVKDATADMALGENIIKGVSSDFLITSGDDYTFLELASRGAQGVISVLSNVIPKQTVELLRRTRKKDFTAQEELLKYKELTNLLFIEANPIPVKAALHLMGIIETNEMRLPLVPLDAKHIESLRKELNRLEILK